MHPILAQVTLRVHAIRAVTDPHRPDASCCCSDVTVEVLRTSAGDDSDALPSEAIHTVYCQTVPTGGSHDVTTMGLAELPDLSAIRCCWDADDIIAALSDTNLASALRAHEALSSMRDDSQRVVLARWRASLFDGHPLSAALIITDIEEHYDSIERVTIGHGYTAGAGFREAVEPLVASVLGLLDNERTALLADVELHALFRSQLAAMYGIEPSGDELVWCAVDWQHRVTLGDGPGRNVVLEALRSLYLGEEARAVVAVPVWAQQTLRLLGGARFASLPVDASDPVLATATVLWLESREGELADFERCLSSARLL